MRCGASASSTARTAVFSTCPSRTLPVYGTIASQFNDPGTNVLYLALVGGDQSEEGHRLAFLADRSPNAKVSSDTSSRPIGVHYLGEIVHAVRGLPQTGRPAGRRRPAAVPVQRRQRGARRAPSHRGTGPPDCPRRRPAQDEPKRFSASGPNGRPPTAATSWWPRSATRRSSSDLFTTSLSGTRIPKVCAAGLRRLGRDRALDACSRTSRAVSPSPPGCSPSSGPKRTPSASSRAKGRPSGPTAASIISRRTTTPSGFPPPSTA